MQAVLFLVFWAGARLAPESAASAVLEPALAPGGGPGWLQERGRQNVTTGAVGRAAGRAAGQQVGAGARPVPAAVKGRRGSAGGSRWRRSRLEGQRKSDASKGTRGAEVTVSRRRAVLLRRHAGTAAVLLAVVVPPNLKSTVIVKVGVRVVAAGNAQARVQVFRLKAVAVLALHDAHTAEPPLIGHNANGDGHYHLTQLAILRNRSAQRAGCDSSRSQRRTVALPLAVSCSLPTPLLLPAPALLPPATCSSH